MIHAHSIPFVRENERGVWRLQSWISYRFSRGNPDTSIHTRRLRKGENRLEYVMFFKFIYWIARMAFFCKYKFIVFKIEKNKNTDWFATLRQSPSYWSRDKILLNILLWDFFKSEKSLR